MNLSQIQSRLAEVFSAQEADPDRAGTAVVMWFDPNGEFYDALGELELPNGVELLVEEPNRLFELKCRLNQDLSGQKLLVYRRRARGELADNWLADVELYAEPFQADATSLLLGEIGAADSYAMRAEAEALRPFLRKARTVKRLRELAPAYKRPEQLRLAALACALGKDVSSELQEVLVNYLVRINSEGAEAAVVALKASGLEGAVRWAVGDALGYGGGPFDAESLTTHVLMSALSATVPFERLAGLERHVSLAHGNACLNVVHRWMRGTPQEVGTLYDACRQVEARCSLPARLETFETDELLPIDVFPCVNEVLLHRYLGSTSALGSRADEMREAIDQRKNLKWYKRVAPYFDALAAMASMQRFCSRHREGFALGEAPALWKAYTEEWWTMDRDYRRFCACLRRAVLSPVGALDDDLKQAGMEVERLYRGWYLEELGRVWDEAAGPALERLGYVEGVDRQEHFCMNEVAGRVKEGCLFVVVSDALRYDVAQGVADALNQQTKGNAELGSMQAVFPSTTACGMAALLPHGSLAYEAGPDGLRALCDGMPCGTREERERVLDAAWEGAVTVGADQLLAMRKTARQELVEGAPVVYVYHNRVDAVGDKATTEHDVALACDEAVEELVGLVKVIVGELRGRRVVITADHGFVYTREPLGASDTVARSEVVGDVVELGKRHAVTRGPAMAEDCVSVSLAQRGEGLAGFSPRGYRRFTACGGGRAFVHGGASLQELCVPVLRFKNERAGSKAYVETERASIELISSTDLVANNQFRLEFFQKEPVGGKVAPAEYDLYMADESGAAVSEVRKFVADQTSPERADRIVRVTFVMLAGAKTSAKETYYLTAVDKGTGTVAWRREFRIDIAFANQFEDFGF